MGDLHQLNIDLETYSDVDIGKAGLYKYVRSPAFEILLFGYSLDGGPRVVVDLAQGEQIPPPIAALLFDPCCLNKAYNAAFEWYCLSKYYGLSEKDTARWLQQWRCTMLHSMYCGYPASLDAAG